MDRRSYESHEKCRYTREIGPNQHEDIRRPGLIVPGESVHPSPAPHCVMTRNRWLKTD